jgi:hypothetical protein
MSGNYGLRHALAAYWDSKNHREQQAAYHEILLFGGLDGYPNYPGWRTVLARMLRKVALWVEGR